MQDIELLKELPKGLIKWYPFQEGKKALFITGGIKACESLCDALKEAGLITKQMPLEAVLQEKEQQIESYDYIILAGALERSVEPKAVLKVLHDWLTETGKLLLGADNRLGIRYFCGDRDAFTERNFDSIENYVRINMADRAKLGGRAYARAELSDMLEASGFSMYRFYAVLPELTRPQMLFAEDYLPEEELEVRVAPQYHCPDTVFLEEERLYTTLIENGLFHAMANGYLIECPMDGCFADVKQVTISMDRGKTDALMTLIRRDGLVEKKALYPEGQRKLTQLLENTRELEQHGIKMVNAWLENGAFMMPYVQGEPVTNYFRRMLKEDQELFLQELDRFWELIKGSSEHVPFEQVDWEHFDPDWKRQKADAPDKGQWKKKAFGSEGEKESLGIILKRGYLDLVSLNCFYIDGEFVFYDQEFYLEPFPANAILIRTIDFIYRGNAQMESLLPGEQLRERYHLNEHLALWRRFSGHFLEELRNERQLLPYHQLYRRDINVIHSNRQRMNYSTGEYERLFRDIFHGTEGRKLYLFGSGNFTKKFLSQFGSEYEVAGILDNDPDRWGKELSGILIGPPKLVQSLPLGTYKVIVCIKNYVPVVRQLRELGVRDFGIYDWNMEYPRKEKAFAAVDVVSEKPKKYHVGYVAGVFDLFHMGHLNLLRRAKEQCDYLIVGVVSDESVMKNKKTSPCIPFEERIELVRACRYVDEAVAIPVEYGDTDEAYRRYHFDVQFSGSDYENDPAWLAKKAFLKKRGADMVFFPYTQSTSSTKLKSLIEKKLL